MYIISYHIITYHIVSYHISYHIIYIISYHIISYRIIYHIVSYHIIYHIYRIISYHTISYHIIYIISYYKSTHIILGKNVVFTVIMQLRASCCPIRAKERRNRVSVWKCVMKSTCEYIFRTSALASVLLLCVQTAAAADTVNYLLLYCCCVQTAVAADTVNYARQK